MIVKDVPPIRILLSVYRLARSTLPKYSSKRGRKGYKLATRIAIVAYLILYKLTLEKAEKELRETGLYKRLGAKKAPDYTTICKWKNMYAHLVRLLIWESFYRIKGFMRIDELTAVADGSGFKDHKYSSYYKDPVFPILTFN
ncbi:MAG: transposase [Candidatus Njordarchaeia archaeon]